MPIQQRERGRGRGRSRELSCLPVSHSQSVSQLLKSVKSVKSLPHTQVTRHTVREGRGSWLDESGGLGIYPVYLRYLPCWYLSPHFDWLLRPSGPQALRVILLTGWMDPVAFHLHSMSRI